jgi:hypothetical protein
LQAKQPPQHDFRVESEAFRLAPSTYILGVTLTPLRYRRPPGGVVAVRGRGPEHKRLAKRHYSCSEQLRSDGQGGISTAAEIPQENRLIAKQQETPRDNKNPPHKNNHEQKYQLIDTNIQTYFKGSITDDFQTTVNPTLPASGNNFKRSFVCIFKFFYKPQKIHGV